MSIPVTPNADYPLVAPAISLINAYLEQEISFQEPPVYQISPYQTLQLRLPRESGSTFICHQAVEFASAFVVFARDDHIEDFQHEHDIMFNKKRPLPIVSTYELKDIRSTSWLNPDLAAINKISDNLRSSSSIFFDVFASYSNNSMVKSLINSCYKTHKFVMLW